MNNRERVSRAEHPEPSGSGEHPRAVSEIPSSTIQASPKRRRSGPWTLAKEFVHEGFSYRVLKRPVNSDEEAPYLTTREEEALFHASNGYSNKRIAQCLGVSPSTVGVLLFRAAAKLGVKSRSDLISSYARIKSERER
jgi:DNA-binding CsgD family transcriptional regulator